ncbi:MAG TPA: DUF2007 domain-containing protein [Tangfeifania sp.]|nr:DUF2007 domain-containing protein [Tangfeifania sp.]
MEEGWKQVFLTGEEYKANMAKDILENDGIKTVLMNRHDTAYKSFGDIEVYVQEADEQKALELLKELKN